MNWQYIPDTRDASVVPRDGRSSEALDEALYALENNHDVTTALDVARRRARGHETEGQKRRAGRVLSTKMERVRVQQEAQRKYAEDRHLDE